MIVHVKLFAVARQLAGSDLLPLEVPAAATVADVRAALAQAVPPLASLLGNMFIAVNADYARDDCPVGPDSDIACIPPVSGG
ncbi:MAG: MoaD/ThiS family protein [Pirellulales bacterium]|nr:MoaD/ThiS family protein [Pirellulales bacterium]